MNPKLNPANFPLGSPESRAIARAMLGRSKTVTGILISTGLPCPRQKPSIAPPDSVSYYLARDGSIVEVSFREYERNKFTAFIHQTWENGRKYHGDCRIESLTDLENLSSLDSRRTEMLLYESQL